MLNIYRQAKSPNGWILGQAKDSNWLILVVAVLPQQTWIFHIKTFPLNVSIFYGWKLRYHDSMSSAIATPYITKWIDQSCSLPIWAYHDNVDSNRTGNCLHQLGGYDSAFDKLWPLAITKLTSLWLWIVYLLCPLVTTNCSGFWPWK